MSSAKEVFFINIGKKILRGAGLAVSGILLALFLLMIVTSAVFGSAGAVGVFGFNLFICESGDYDSVPAGSAVITTSCAPYDLEEGNLVLYSTDPMDKNAPLAMGYYSDFKMIDGVYYLSLVNGSDSAVISEAALIGKAGWCSPFLGQFIAFTKTPWGVFVMAVIPCALLLLCDLLRVRASEKPIPEIVPQVKNADAEDVPRQPQFAVGENGSAAYRKNPAGKQTTADSVLFTFGQEKKKPAAKPGEPTMSDADVLALLNAPSTKNKPKPEPAAKAAVTDKPVLPAPVAAKRYLDNTISQPEQPAVSPAKPVKTAPAKPDKSEKAEKPARAVSGKTAELPVQEKPRQKRPDAFFAQSEAPQIGKGLAGRQSSRSIIDLEDALAAVPSRNPKNENTRRSADILASKDRRSLIADDDDARDKSRYEVDDILAGIEKRHQK